MSANTVEIRSGRLLEIRAEMGYRTAADVDDMFARIEKALLEASNPERWVVVVDWRRCPIMSPEAASRMTEGMARNNARVERSAALASRDAPLAVLQFVRLIRDAAHPDRRLFHEAEDVAEWLGGVLTTPEVQRLRSFLAG